MSPYLIFETASVHAGDPDRLFVLMDHLAPSEETQRKGLKFHPISAETLATPSFEFFDIYRKLEIPRETWGRIIARASHFYDVWLEMADANCIAVFLDNRDRVFGVKLQASMLQNEEVLNLLQAFQVSHYV